MAKSKKKPFTLDKNKIKDKISKIKPNFDKNKKKIPKPNPDFKKFINKILNLKTNALRILNRLKKNLGFYGQINSIYCLQL